MSERLISTSKAFINSSDDNFDNDNDDRFYWKLIELRDCLTFFENVTFDR
jgi:hypothetical protein